MGSSLPGHGGLRDTSGRTKDAIVSILVALHPKSRTSKDSQERRRKRMLGAAGGGGGARAGYRCVPKGGDSPTSRVGNSPGNSLITNYFQSCFKSFTYFNIPTAYVFFICSHPYRLSPQISKSNLSSLSYVLRL